VSWIRQTLIVAAAEFRLQVHSPAWRVSVLLAIGLGLAAGAAGVADVHRLRSETAVLEARRAESRGDGARPVNGLTRDEALRILPSTRASRALVRDDPGVRYWDIWPEGTGEGFATSPVPTSSSEFDVEFVVRGLVGLLALTVGAGSLLTARHRATSKMLLALPVFPGALLTGALLGGQAAVSIIAAGVVGSALAAIHLAGDGVTGDVLASAGGLLLSALLLAATALGLGATISLLNRSTAQAVAGILATWLVGLTLGVPVPGIVAFQITPLPARAFFEADRSRVFEASIRELEQQAGAVVVAEYGPAAAVNDGPVTAAVLTQVGAVWDRGMPDVRARVAQLDRVNDSALGALQRRHWWLSLPLPGAVFENAAAEFAGIGPAARAQAAVRVREFQIRMNAEVFDTRRRLHARLPIDGTYSRLLFYDRAPMLTTADLAVVEIHSPTAAERLVNGWASLLVLTAQAVGTWIAALAVFFRRQARTGAWP
jgi:hypothetical protein